MPLDNISTQTDPKSLCLGGVDRVAEAAAAKEEQKRSAKQKRDEEKVIREKFGSIQSNDVTTFMMSKEFRKRKSESLPDLKVEFLDFDSMVRKQNSNLQEIQKYFGPNNKTKYYDLQIFGDKYHDIQIFQVRRHNSSL